MANFSDMIYPGRGSAQRVAQLANIALEDGMQDWPIEVSDPTRLDEFIELLLANKANWELSYWLLDLVLESAWDDMCITPPQDNLPERTEPLVDVLVAVWEATKAPRIALRLENWACVDATAPDEMFGVSPLVWEARRRIGLSTVHSADGRIHLLDSASSTEPADQPSDSALFDYLALTEDAVGIRTGVDGNVSVGIEVLDAAPVDDNTAFDSVTECSLRVDSGRLRLTSLASDAHGGGLVAVPAGWLRLRVLLFQSPDANATTGVQHVQIQCWPAEHGNPVLVREQNPNAA
ncbi:hypothetical protein AB0H76_35320 [Nocardia sp. NPDC050712]|uniref:hypothetical protein n=1 Tax=Nocardia sp. NPDC050712 TaxID=3155518 RepID=UPI003403950F